MAIWTETLNPLSFRAFPGLFSTLTVPDEPRLSGYYRGTYVGPGWLRATAGPSMVLSGLGGWWGKYFMDDNNAINLVQHDGKLEQRFPMKLVKKTSILDGNPSLVLLYDQRSSFPWPYMVDELRQLDNSSYLGMMHINSETLGRLAFPFLLQYQEHVDGL